MKLIDDWKKFWRFKSIQFGVIGAALSSIFLAMPEAAIYAWAAMPEDIKSFLPPEVIKFTGIGILFLSFVARIVKQPKLESKNNE